MLLLLISILVLLQLSALTVNTQKAIKRDVNFVIFSGKHDCPHHQKTNGQKQKASIPHYVRAW